MPRPGLSPLASFPLPEPLSTGGDDIGPWPEGGREGQAGSVGEADAWARRGRTRGEPARMGTG